MSHTVYVISGPSGTGKTSTMRRIMENEILSFTTRPIRKGEKHGVDYNYISTEELKALEDQNLLVEKVTYSGNFYGISKTELEEKTAKSDAFVIVDYHGYTQLQKLYDNIVSIFFVISEEEAKQRMLERGDAPETIEKRLITFSNELKNQVHYDYVIENKEGMQEQTIEQVKAIIERTRTTC